MSTLSLAFVRLTPSPVAPPFPQTAAGKSTQVQVSLGAVIGRPPADEDPEELDEELELPEVDALELPLEDEAAVLAAELAVADEPAADEVELPRVDPLEVEALRLAVVVPGAPELEVVTAGLPEHAPSARKRMNRRRRKVLM